MEENSPAPAATSAKLFSTRDIALAATLLTLKFKVAGIDYQIEGVNPKPIGYFSFVDSEKLEEVVGKYWQNGVLVEPREYMSNIRALKSEITGTYKNPYSRMGR